MEKLKNNVLKMLYPSPIIFISFFIIGFGSVIITFIYGLENHWFSYISYILSAYALIITSVKIPKIYKFCYKKLESIELINKIIHDYKFRNHLGLYLGVIFNVCYVIFKFIVSIMYKSIWVSANAIYYLVITIIRFILLKTSRKKVHYKENLKKYRLTGFLLLVLNLTMMIMVFQMVVENQTFKYPGHIIYVTTLYSFYSMTVAIINIVKYRKVSDPIFQSVKILSLAIAIMSLFATQTALINEFGNGDESFRLLMNSLTGTATIISVIGIAIFMIINSQKRLERLELGGKQ